jgi:hypothetical protein
VVGGIGHVADLLLHLLFGYLFSCGLGSYGGPGIALGDHSVYDLVDKGGCVRGNQESQ